MEPVLFHWYVLKRCGYIGIHTKHTCNTTELDALFEAEAGKNPGYPCYNYTLPTIGFWQPATNDPFVLTTTSLSNLVQGGVVNGFFGIEVMNIAQVASNSSLIAYIMMYQPVPRNGPSNSPLPPPVAYSITLDFCLHTYNTPDTDGVPSTVLVSSQIYDLAVEQELTPIGNDYFLSANETSIAFEGQNFTVSGVAASYLAIASQNIFLGSCLQPCPTSRRIWSHDNG